MSCSRHAQSSTSRSTLRSMLLGETLGDHEDAQAVTLHRSVGHAGRLAQRLQAGALRIGRYEFVGEQAGHVRAEFSGVVTSRRCYCRSMRGARIAPREWLVGIAAALICVLALAPAATAARRKRLDRLLAARRRALQPVLLQGTSASPKAHGSATSRATRRWSGPRQARSKRSSRASPPASRRRHRARPPTR